MSRIINALALVIMDEIAKAVRSIPQKHIGQHIGEVPEADQGKSTFEGQQIAARAVMLFPSSLRSRATLPTKWRDGTIAVPSKFVVIHNCVTQ